jgi:hypothetical protein
MSKEDKKHCEKCSTELTESEIYELDNVILCQNCFNEEEDLNGISEEWI